MCFRYGVLLLFAGGPDILGCLAGRSSSCVFVAWKEDLPVGENGPGVSICLHVCLCRDLSCWKVIILRDFQLPCESLCLLHMKYYGAESNMLVHVADVALILFHTF